MITIVIIHKLKIAQQAMKSAILGVSQRGKNGTITSKVSSGTDYIPDYVYTTYVVVMMMMRQRRLIIHREFSLNIFPINL